MHLRQITMTAHACVRVFFKQPLDICLQRFPLLRGEFVSPDQAHADGFAIEAFGMRSDLIQVATGRNSAVGVDQEMVTDGCQRIIQLLPEIQRAREPTLTMPVINVRSRCPATVRRSRTMNDDAGDLSGSHAAMMAA